MLRAIEAVATSVPLFLLLFAATYVVLAPLSDTNFGGHHAPTASTPPAPCDMAAVTETARLVVTRADKTR